MNRKKVLNYLIGGFWPIDYSPRELVIANPEERKVNLWRWLEIAFYEFISPGTLTAAVTSLAYIVWWNKNPRDFFSPSVYAIIALIAIVVVSLSAAIEWRTRKKLRQKGLETRDRFEGKEFVFLGSLAFSLLIILIVKTILTIPIG